MLVCDIPSIFHVPLPSRDTDPSRAWRSLIPALWENANGLDRRWHWTESQSSVDVVQREWDGLLGDGAFQLHHHRHHYQQQQQQQRDLIQAMETFEQFCQSHLQRPQSYAARVVCARGSLSTKCPRWHTDDVPVRWIQSMVGPGVQWLDHPPPPTFDDVVPGEWDLAVINDNPSHPWRTVDFQHRRHQVSEGQAALLVGRRWGECATNKDSESISLSNFEIDSSTSGTANPRPCVNKSPEGLMPWEGRVLLTLDVFVGQEIIC